MEKKFPSEVDYLSNKKKQVVKEYLETYVEWK